MVKSVKSVKKVNSGKSVKEKEKETSELCLYAGVKKKKKRKVLYSICDFKGCMVNKYVSKKEKVRDLINNTFWPANKDIDPVIELPIDDLYFSCLQRYGASEGVVRDVVELFIRVGYLRLNDKKLVRVKDYKSLEGVSGDE